MKRINQFLTIIIFFVLLFSCNKEKDIISVVTTEVMNITDSTAIVKGEVLFGENSKKNVSGVAWSLNSNPTKDDDFILANNAEDIFVKLSGLKKFTTYYVRVFAENKKGITYGNELEFFTPNNITSNTGQGVTDIDGNFYPTIVLGNGQEWMAQNLRTTTCSDGTVIPNVEDYYDWYELSSPGWAYYENNAQFNFPYGKLYNWYTVRDCSVCPEGWRAPNNEDWDKLRDYLSPDFNNSGSNDAASKMKVTGSNYWAGSNDDANNLIGFSAYPGGIRGGGFHSMEYGAFWWSNTLKDESENYPTAHYRVAVWGNPSLGGASHHIGDGLSIRCLKN